MKNSVYTAGLRVKAKAVDKHEHMTIAYLGENNIPHDEFMNMFSEEIKKLPKMAWITGEEMLGPNKDVAVWIIQIEPEAENAVTSIWKVLNVEQEHTKGLTKPKLHVTKKTGTDRVIGETLYFTHVFVKQIGSHDPYINEPIGG